MDWNQLKTFHAVAEAGSFSGAAAHLHISQTVVSRHIRYLEDHFQTSLLHRHARGVVLSQQGELLFKTAHNILMQLVFTQVLLEDGKDTPRNVLRIQTPPGFGLLICMANFMENHPDLRLEISLDYHNKKKIDFKNIDIVISTEPIFYTDVISTFLLKEPLRIYASRAYLKKFGVPFKPSHLDHHRLIVFDEGPHGYFPYSDYLLALGASTSNPRRPFLSINNILGIAQFVEEDLGISLLSPHMVSPSKNIIQILPEVPEIFVEFYLIYPEKLKKTSRVQAFQKFIFQEIDKSPWGKPSGGAIYSQTYIK